MSTTEDRSSFEETQDKGEIQVYELGYLVLPSIAEDNLPKVVESIKKIIAQAEGRELDGEAPFKHDLVYPMSKVVGSSKYVVNDAYIGWIKFETEPSKVNEIKEAVEKLDEILRFILIKVPRETTFTFESARKAQMEKENPEKPAEEEVEASADDADASESASEEDVVE